MITRKLLAAGMLSVLLAVSLSACGNSEKKTSDTAASSSNAGQENSASASASSAGAADRENGTTDSVSSSPNADQESAASASATPSAAPQTSTAAVSGGTVSNGVYQNPDIGLKLKLGSEYQIQSQEGIDLLAVSPAKKMYMIVTVNMGALAKGYEGKTDMLYDAVSPGIQKMLENQGYQNLELSTGNVRLLGNDTKAFMIHTDDRNGQTVYMSLVLQIKNGIMAEVFTASGNSMEEASGLMRSFEAA